MKEYEIIEFIDSDSEEYKVRGKVLLTEDEVLNFEEFLGHSDNLAIREAK